MRRSVYVIPRGAEWVVVIWGENEPRGIFGVQEEALEAARQLARREQDEIVVEVSDPPKERAADL